MTAIIVIISSSIIYYLNDTATYYAIIESLQGRFLGVYSYFRKIGDPIESEIIPYIERAWNGEPVLPDQIINTSWGIPMMPCIE